MAPTIVQLIELRLQNRHDAAVTALIDRCLVAATKMTKAAADDAAREEFEILAGTLAPLLGGGPVHRWRRV